MDAASVRDLIRSQLGGRREGADWPHGVSLEHCLVDPPTRQTFHVAWDPTTSLDLWLVLEEHGEGTYCIAFDEDEGQFGIATRIEDGLLLLGFYGSFVETLEAL